ncbi:MAG: ABC transporter substrate-binding protein [Pyramidobacter sp.]
MVHIKALRCTLLTALILSAAVCASADAPKSTKDTLMWGVNAEAASLDPATSKDSVTHMMMMQLYDTLVNTDPQDYTKFIPCIATEWKFSDDKKEITFTIRQNVKFHNGDVMTVDDVIYSLNRSLKSSYSSGVRGPLQSFEKIDDSHIKALLKHPYSPILEVLSNYTFGIVSKRAVEEAEAKGVNFARNPCGTGAYKLKEWKSGDQLVLERFDDYWNGAAPIKTIVYKLVPDAASGAIALEDGSLDFYYAPTHTDYQYLETLDNLASITCPGIGLRHITFNVTDGIFKDKRLRQAVAYALNRDDILIGGCEGHGENANVLCPTSIFGYDKEATWYPQDLKKAKELMAEAGYPNGFDVVFSMQGSSTYMRPAEVMQDQLRQIGINVTFDKMERATYLDIVAGKRQFVASLRMINATVRDADFVLTRRVHGSMIGGGNNYSGYNNPDVNKWIDEARQEEDPSKRMELYKKVYAQLKEDVPLIPLYTSYGKYFFNKHLKGIYPHPVMRFPVHEMYFD